MSEDDCQLLGVHMRLSTRGKIWFTLGMFANYFLLKSLSLSLKIHMNVLLSLLFNLNYEVINGSLAFSPWLNIYITCGRCQLLF